MPCWESEERKNAIDRKQTLSRALEVDVQFSDLIIIKECFISSSNQFWEHMKRFSFTVLLLYLASCAVLFSIKIIYRKGDCNLFRGAWVIWWSSLGLILTDSAGAHLQLSSPGNIFHILVMFESYWELFLFMAVHGLWRLLFSYLACLRSFLQSDIETDQLEQSIHTWLHIIIKIMYKKVVQRWSK